MNEHICECFVSLFFRCCYLLTQHIFPPLVALQLLFETLAADVKRLLPALPILKCSAGFKALKKLLVYIQVNPEVFNFLFEQFVFFNDEFQLLS